jgi:hypothetical protein
MTTIDHRILIPVPQAVVWDYISKLSNLMRWQVDLKSVAILTTKGEGVGTRWRETHEGGREYVAEIRAWYDGLGYQYVYVERPPFKYAVGTVRLQEIAEGTIVQWTLEYETGGVLSGVRNALGTSRQLDAIVQGSLKKLYLQLKTDRARSLEPGIETKALMRDAPDAEARAQYKPRHPSALNESDMPLRPPVSTGAVIFEPPINQDDTRPTRAILAITDEQIAEAPPTRDRASLQEPDFISSIPNLSEDTSPLRDALGNAQPIDTDAVRRELHEPEPSLPGIVIPEPEPTDSQRLMDTSNMSIWEIFGVPRPSETGEMRKVVVEPPAIVEAAPPAAKPKTGRTKKVAAAAPIEDSAPVAVSFAPLPANAGTNRGLRARMRKRLVRLRDHN